MDPPTPRSRASIDGCSLFGICSRVCDHHCHLLFIVAPALGAQLHLELADLDRLHEGRRRRADAVGTDVLRSNCLQRRHNQQGASKGQQSQPAINATSKHPLKSEARPPALTRLHIAKHVFRTRAARQQSTASARTFRNRLRSLSKGHVNERDARYGANERRWLWSKETQLAERQFALTTLRRTAMERALIASRVYHRGDTDDRREHFNPRKQIKAPTSSRQRRSRSHFLAIRGVANGSRSGERSSVGSERFPRPIFARLRSTRIAANNVIR
jgi:hypothetical protein